MPKNKIFGQAEGGGCISYEKNVSEWGVKRIFVK